MILLPNKWLFVSTMKCATNSLYKALKEQVEGTEWVGGKGFHATPNTRMAPTHWTTCRNPYDRAVSIWHSTCMRAENQHRYDAFSYIKTKGGDPLSFPDFVELVLFERPELRNPWLWRNQSGWHDRFPLDEIVRVEELEIELFRRLRLYIHIPFENVSHGREPWEHYYTDALVAGMVKSWAGEDFERYGYEK